MTPIPVTILTGFLGAGKTTLLNRLLKLPQFARTAVLINEVGAVGLDHLLVDHIAEDVVLMEDGCICCTFRDDVGPALEALLPRIRAGEISRVIIETTGLADPAPLVYALFSTAATAMAFRLDGLVTVVDAQHGAGQIASEYEAAQQVAMADRLILSKLDLAGPEAAADIDWRLRLLNRPAPLLSVQQVLDAPVLILDTGLYNTRTGQVDIPRWLGPDLTPAPHKAPPLTAQNRHQGLNRFVLHCDSPVVWSSFQRQLEALLAFDGDHILRIKGIIQLEGETVPCAIHAVKRYLYPPALLAAWPQGDGPFTRMVVLARDLDAGRLADAFPGWSASAAS